MDELSINILVEAKTEYTKQLTNILVPYLYEGIESIHKDAITLVLENENTELSNLKMFQDLLRKIPKWNQDIIDNETQRILDRSQCIWLPDLIAAVFVSNTKILTAVRMVNNKKKINLRIPKLSNFIHKCYIECAREFYKNPFLFDKDNITNVEKQRNLRESLLIANQCIWDAIRKLLPFQEILQQYLGESFMENDDITDNNYSKVPVRKSQLNQYLSDSDSDSESDKDSDRNDDIKEDKIGGGQDDQSEEILIETPPAEKNIESGQENLSSNVDGENPIMNSGSKKTIEKIVETPIEESEIDSSVIEEEVDEDNPKNDNDDENNEENLPPNDKKIGEITEEESKEDLVKKNNMTPPIFQIEETIMGNKFPVMTGGENSHLSNQTKNDSGTHENIKNIVLESTTTPVNKFNIDAQMKKLREMDDTSLKKSQKRIIIRRKKHKDRLDRNQRENNLLFHDDVIEIENKKSSYDPVIEKNSSEGEKKLLFNDAEDSE